MLDWEPIAEIQLLARISQGYARMTEAQQRLWHAIRINPEKWQQHPYGDGGGGFWTVALVGRTAIWYNDLEKDSIARSIRPMVSSTTTGAMMTNWMSQCIIS